MIAWSCATCPSLSLLADESASEIAERMPGCAASAFSLATSSIAAHAGPPLPAFSTPPTFPCPSEFPEHSLSSPGTPLSSDVCTAAAAHSTGASADRMYDGADRLGAMCVATKALRARAAAKFRDASPLQAGLRGTRECVSPPATNCCMTARGARGMAAHDGGNELGVANGDEAPQGALDPTPAMISVSEVRGVRTWD